MPSPEKGAACRSDPVAPSPPPPPPPPSAPNNSSNSLSSASSSSATADLAPSSPHSANHEAPSLSARAAPTTCRTPPSSTILPRNPATTAATPESYHDPQDPRRPGDHGLPPPQWQETSAAAAAAAAADCRDRPTWSPAAGPPVLSNIESRTQVRSATPPLHHHRLYRPSPPARQLSADAGQSRLASQSIKRSARQARAADLAMEQVPVKKPRTGESPKSRLEKSALAGVARPLALAQAQREPFPAVAAAAAAVPQAPTTHPIRPISSGASEMVATMLTRNRDDTASSVTTVKLPRASISSASPAMSGSTTGSLGSSADISFPSTSPENRNLPASLPTSLQVIHGIGAIELLEYDDRPTFLLDLVNPPNPSRPSLNILYHNTSMRTCQDVYGLVNAEAEQPADLEAFHRFRTWSYATVNHNEDPPLPLPYHEYGGITWTSTTLRQRFRFISGNLTPLALPTAPSPLPLPDESVNMDAESIGPPTSLPPTCAADGTEPSDYFADANSPRRGEAFSLGAIQSKLDHDHHLGPVHPDEFTNQVLQVQPTRTVFDWTKIPDTEGLPEHIRFAKSVDWAATSLGPMSEWSNDLRAMSNLVMGSPHAAAMYWGPDLICIYNAAYIEMAGGKHPRLMGRKYNDAWAEIWPEVQPVFRSAVESGQATMKHDNHLFIIRSGFLEETFFSWAIVPLVGSEGEVVGLYNPAFENTLRKVNDRRMLTLREIGERTATAMSVSGFWPQVQKGLEYNEYDVPFSLIYSVREETESEASSLHSGSFAHSSQVLLEGSPGVPEGHPAAPAFLDLKSDEGFAPYMRQCMTSGGDPVVLSERDGTLPSEMIQGFHWRGFGDPCTTVVVFPVVPTTSKEAVTGFIVLGVNPRRPYDDNYQLFIHLLSRQLATSMASVVLFEEEIRRGQRAARLAAIDRQELSMQLLLRTQEASESEFRFTRMAEFAPVGMFIADGEGHINYCNDMWWRISRRSRSSDAENQWMDSVRKEDRPSLEAAWQRLLDQRDTISVEFRFRHSQQSGENTIDTWVLMSAFPEQDQEGNLKSIFGCITDISSQKWAEKVQTERREEAVELKRQQENFIDITSHEMRNPLSAVLQCADQISSNISTYTAFDAKEKIESLLENCLDAANTINLCASHQKRIVDDILTLSKLDSSLLAVTPVDEQPIKVVQQALKMFESELAAHDIELIFNVGDSFERHGVQWAKLDPSRLRQVFINLMTNAIKFTQGREKRCITVTLNASRDINEVTSQGVAFFQTSVDQRKAKMDINEQDWGEGERINIHCSVEDTGPGLAEQELKLLFQRFQQASPRTHVQYGGSGLGLFISRILTEMQGGQIGVTSRPGVGSKFNFYIQSRKSLHPPADYERISPFRIGRKTQSPSLSAIPDRSVNESAPHAALAPNGRTPFDVLIVEDNIVNQKVLQRQLSNCGNKTFVANHGREALQTLQQSRFWAGMESKGVDISVILMDLEMPVMDGMTCAKKIRELEKEGTIVKHIPIIAVTAYARPEQIEDAKAAGIDDVISKPFRVPELIPKIEELVGRYERVAAVSAEA